MEPQHPLKIFLVDDDPYCLHLYAQYLNNFGFTQIQYFSKSTDCLNQLTIRPDLIFLDHNMDSFNGIDILKKIKQFDPNIIVIFISGQEEIDVAVNALKHGAFDYITKENITEKKIRACLDKVLLIKETLLKKHKLRMANKVMSGIGAFPIIFAIQRLIARI